MHPVLPCFITFAFNIFVTSAVHCYDRKKVIFLGTKYISGARPVKRPGIQITSKMLSKEVEKINGNKTTRNSDIIRYYHRDD